MKANQILDVPVEAKGLGDPVAEFPVNRLTFAFWAALFPVAFITFGGAAIVTGYTVFTDPSARSPSLVFWIAEAIGVASVIAGAAILVLLFRNRLLRVCVFSEGFVEVCTRKVTVCRWADVSSLRLEWKILRGFTTAYTLTVEVAGGRETHLDSSIDGIRDLTRLVQENVLQHQLPEAWRMIQANATVYFGHYLAANRDGVFTQKGSMNWAGIDACDLNKGFLSIKRKGSFLYWLHLETGAISDLQLFLAICQRLRVS